MRQAYAVLRFVPEGEKEVAIEKGDQVEILQDDVDGWTLIRNPFNAVGFVPSTYIREITINSSSNYNSNNQTAAATAEDASFSVPAPAGGDEKAPLLAPSRLETFDGQQMRSMNRSEEYKSASASNPMHSRSHIDSNSAADLELKKKKKRIIMSIIAAPSITLCILILLVIIIPVSVDQMYFQEPSISFFNVNYTTAFSIKAPAYYQFDMQVLFRVKNKNVIKVSAPELNFNAYYYNLYTVGSFSSLASTSNEQQQQKLGGPGTHTISQSAHFTSSHLTDQTVTLLMADQFQSSGFVDLTFNGTATFKFAGKRRVHEMSFVQRFNYTVSQ